RSDDLQATEPQTLNQCDIRRRCVRSRPDSSHGSCFNESRTSLKGDFHVHRRRHSRNYSCRPSHRLACSQGLEALRPPGRWSSDALSPKPLQPSHRSAEDRPSPDAPPGQIRRMTAPRTGGSRSVLFPGGKDQRGRRSSAPRRSWRWNGLLVIADATGQIADLSYKTHLRHWLRVCTRLWEHVADLGDLTLRLFTRGVEFGAKILAGAVLKGPLVLPKLILFIRIALRNDLAVADIGAKYI